MKKGILFLLVVLTSCNLALAQDNSWNDGWGGKRVKGMGPVVKENRDVKDFNGISSGISADIYIKQAQSFKVTLEGQKNITDLIKLEVKNGVLKIGFEKGYSVNYKEPLKVYVEAPSFEKLGMSGSGNVIAENSLSGKALDISISGSGDFSLQDLKYEDVNVSISGSGDMNLSGSTNNISLSISGSGDIKAGALKAKKVNCNVSGSGDIVCNASDSLEAYVSGSGDIRYKGSPANVKTKVSGSGDIEKAE